MGAVVRATSVSASLVDLLAGTARGVVLAVFERSIYLDLEGRIVALTAARLGQGPLSVVVERVEAVRPLAAGERARAERGVLCVGRHTIDTRAAAAWNPTLPVADCVERLGPAAAEVVCDELTRSAPASSVAALALTAPPACLIALPDSSRHRTLLCALSRGLEVLGNFLAGRANVALMTAAVARDIAGHGPGLTPSGDDLLTGVMHAVTTWPQIAAGGAGTRAPTELRSLLADAACPHTTRISAAYLEAAARGEAAEPWHILAASLGQSNAATRLAARRLLRIGDTSGADALTGFCWAWRRLWT